ncbi:putative TLC domain-containing protein [Helianthus anomalus]
MKLQVSFPVIFTLVRMCVGPYLCYVTMSAKNPILIMEVGVGLVLVSAFWFYKIAKVVKYKLVTKSTFKTC